MWVDIKCNQQNHIIFVCWMFPCGTCARFHDFQWILSLSHSHAENNSIRAINYTKSPKRNEIKIAFRTSSTNKKFFAKKIFFKSVENTLIYVKMFLFVKQIFTFLSFWYKKPSYIVMKWQNGNFSSFRTQKRHRNNIKSTKT